MATTVTSLGPMNAGDFLHIGAVDLTTIVPNESVDVDTSALTSRGCAPSFIMYNVEVEATSGSPVLDVEHIKASDVTTAGSETVRIKVKTEVGGDLSGATVRVFFVYLPAASGGNRIANA